MYVANGNEELVEPSGIPHPIGGAPNPLIVSDEHKMILGYYTADENAVVREEDFEKPVMVGMDSELQPCCLLRASYWKYVFGPPGMDKQDLHPLHTLGLEYCRVQEVRRSQWIKDEGPPSGYSKHARKAQTWIHLVITFHDSTFEGLLSDIEVEIVERSVLDGVLRAYFK